MASTSASSPSVPCNYEVFLNFRGVDVRNSFLSHLEKALVRAGINTFKDDKELERGKEINPELLKAIESSTIAITVFSENYADSKSCLDELVKILDCKDKLGQVVLPIFFYLDPSDVSNQRGSFGKRFAVHQTVAEEKIESWKTALSKAGNIAGFTVGNGTTKNEAEVIETIIACVLEKLPRTYLSDEEGLFGIEYPVRNIISLLSLNSEDVRFIGIYGMAGIGKTTVAKEIRKRILSKFYGNCFLEDVKLGSKRDGLVELQKRLLFDILRVRDLHLSDIDDGIDKIRRRLRNKKVLIILDNVDNFKQLDALAKERRWFGIGSRIIVICRDEHLLNVHGMDAKHEVLRLNSDDDRQLFSWHAFRQHGPPADYADCALEIVRYAQGHPLALKALGAFLCDKTDLSEWTSALEELKSTQPPEIFGTLKICFDLLEHEQKNTFLDIAFFFVGRDKDHAIHILDGCPGFRCIHLHILTQKCLLTISENKVGMHDLLQEMAKEIVRRENYDKPGERSRLNSCKDVRKVLKYNQGTDKVIGLKGIFPELREKPFKTEAVAKMNEVRILQLRNALFVGGCEQLSEELRWLCWERCPWESVPPSLNLKRLVVLELRCSNLQHLWEQTKVLKKLKVLDLSHSHNLIRTSDISGLSSVEKLIFKDCINLTELHHSIGKLSKLICLDLENCKNLVYLPEEICELSSLEKLNLPLCSKLKGLKNLTKSVSHLKTFKGFLYSIMMGSAGDYSLSRLWSLASAKELNLSFCNLSDTSLPGDFGGLPNLEKLFLKGNTFHCLPTCLSHIPKLKKLDVSECDLSGTTSPMVLTNPSLRELDLSKNNFCRLAVDLTSLPLECGVSLIECKKIQAVETISRWRLVALDCTSLEKLTFKGELNCIVLAEEESFEPSFLVCYRGCEKLVEIEGEYKLKPLTGSQLDELERLFGLDFGYKGSVSASYLTRI
ncbi:hypothetical protein SLEP1_g20174 [Rubroshorea leprosula]|uniref:TIR domain-containing protein n=1 Tax=Rubroshorea leprosula TaxID=152421 RepID=A0AAV5JCB2_9ROSI|nr:hypothetical protein SLEP1_g20174 [Rubroshorea leprosula]